MKVDWKKIEKIQNQMGYFCTCDICKYLRGENDGRSRSNKSYKNQFDDERRR